MGQVGLSPGSQGQKLSVSQEGKHLQHDESLAQLEAE